MTIADGNDALAADVLAIAATANSALTAAGAASANATTALANAISAQTIAAQVLTASGLALSVPALPAGGAIGNNDLIPIGQNGSTVAVAVNTFNAGMAGSIAAVGTTALAALTTATAAGVSAATAIVNAASATAIANAASVAASQAFTIGGLPVVTNIGAADLVLIGQAGATVAVTTANLLAAQTIDQLVAAGAASDTDTFLTGQGTNVITRQTMAAIWAWLKTHLPGYQAPVQEIAGNTTIDGTYNGNILVVTAAGVVLTPNYTLMGAGFACEVVTSGAGAVTWGSGVTATNGASGLPAGSYAKLLAVTSSAGNVVLASVGSPAAGGATPPGAISGLTLGATTATTLAFTWTAPSTGGTATYYAAQHRVTSAGGSWTAAPNTSVASATLTGLASSTQYDVQVAAGNAGGTGAYTATAAGTTAAAWGTYQTSIVRGTSGIIFNLQITSGTAPTIVDSASAGIDALNKRIAALTAPAERFNKSVQKFGEVSGINRAAEGVQTLGDRALGAARSIERLAGPMLTITSLASLGGIAELSRKWAEAGNQIARTSYALNTPVPRLSAPRGAARLAGVSTEAMDASLKGLGDTLATAKYKGGPMVPLLNQLHIGFQGVGKYARTGADALGDVADAVARYKDPHAQVRILQQFGISEELLPLLQKGRKGLEEYLATVERSGGAMTAEMATNATKMHKSWVELGLAIEGVGNQIVNSWSGVSTKMLDTTTNWIKNNKELAVSYTENAAAVATAIGLLVGLRVAPWILTALGLGGTAGALALPLALSGDAAQNPQAKIPYDPVTSPNLLDRNGAVGRWWMRTMPGWLGGESGPTKRPSGPRADAVPGGAGNALDGPTVARAKLVYAGLKARGMDSNTAWGFAANAVQESGANPNSPPATMAPRTACSSGGIQDSAGGATPITSTNTGARRSKGLWTSSSITQCTN